MKIERSEIVKAFEINDLDNLSLMIDSYKTKYPNDFFGWNMDGLLNEKNDFLDIALESFLKSEKLNSKLILIKINITRILFKLSEKKRCKEKLKEILILDKENLYAKKLLTNIYFEDKEYEEIINIFPKSKDIHENDVPLLKKIAISHFFLKDFSSAKYFFEKLTHIDPNTSENYLDLGASFYNLNNLNEALFNFIKALELKYNYQSIANFNKIINETNIKYDDFSNEIEVYNSSLRDNVSIKF